MVEISEITQVARFEKVCLDAWKKDFAECFPGTTEQDAVEAYEHIQLPKRSTKGSAGYDFFMPVNQTISKYAPKTIPTGIRVSILPGWFLGLIPRSGLGFRYGMRLENTFGCIDPDYYYADNGGHILARLSTPTTFSLKVGDRFMQGVFMPFGITVDDEADGERTGGFGSTGGMGDA